MLALVLGLLGLLRASAPDPTDLMFKIDDKHRVLTLQIEHSWLEALNNIESDYKELLSLADVLESSTSALQYYTQDLCSVKGTAKCTSEELLIKTKPEVISMIDGLRALTKELDAISVTVSFKGEELEYFESLRGSIESDADQLEDKLSLNEGLDTFLKTKLNFMAMELYDRLEQSLSFTQQLVVSRQTDLERQRDNLPPLTEYKTISELANQLHHYADTYKHYFNLFTSILKVKQNFVGTVPSVPVDFIPNIEEAFLSTLTEMNKNMRAALKLDEPLPFKEIHASEDINKVKEEFLHFNYLHDENKEHLHNKEEYEKLFYPDQSDIQVGLLEGNFKAKAVILDAVLVNPEGCPEGNEHPFDEIMKFGSISVVYSKVPDVNSHPEWIEPHVPPTDDKVTLNLKGLRELRKIIFNQFQLTLNSGHSTMIINKMGCTKCRSVMRQVAHIYAEAIKMFSKQNIHSIFFVDEELYTSVQEFAKGF